MPELPEVETIRRGLDGWITGRRIGSVAVHHPRAVRRHHAGPRDFADRLAGAGITGTRRRGKFLWLPLDTGDALLCHLGMSGQLLIQPPGNPDGPHLRVRFDFDAADHQLRFVDQRTFGEMLVSPGGAELPGEIAHIAPDVYDPGFDVSLFAERLRRRRGELKRALLDQSLISGVGNIYADEALWRARLHGGTLSQELSDADVRELLGHVKDVFDAALSAGGTSFDDLYVNTNGESGYFDRSLAVYGRADRPCPRCGTAVTRIKFTNRSSFQCPACQPS